MCGIMCYTGEDNAAHIILNGLKELEYRGYDSAGIAVNGIKGTCIVKTEGSPVKLQSKIGNISGSTGIGHTRWATHGEANETNAHPHVSGNGMFTVVHNGIIENYEVLKEQLIKKGYKFRSETDTEVIANLLENKYNGDLKGTVGEVMNELKGSYALGILCKDYPDRIVCAKMSSPLFVGTATGSGYIASDISAIAEKSDRIFRLNDGEIGLLQKDSFKVFDTDGCRIRKSEVKIKAYERLSDKGKYKHYMLKEIFEQPDAVRLTLSSFLNENGKIRFRTVRWSSEEIKNIKNVIFVACGSAYHAGLTGSYAAEQIFKRPSYACTASEFRYKRPCMDENTLVIIISQSGETADTLAALRMAVKKKAKVISVVNVESSSIAQESDCVILTKAGREVAVATTKAYMAQLTVIYSLMIYLGTVSEEISRGEAKKLIDEIKTIPGKTEKILQNSSVIKQLAELTENSEYICFIGRGYDYCSAMEASLKLKEISYIPSEAYAAGELKHGTISLVDDKSLIVALACSEELKSKTESNINEVRARGAKVLTITADEKEDEFNFIIPHTFDIFYPMLEIVPLQLFAYYTAEKLGCAIDKPKNLAKSVTVE